MKTISKKAEEKMDLGTIFSKFLEKLSGTKGDSTLKKLGNLLIAIFSGKQLANLKEKVEKKKEAKEAADKPKAKDVEVPEKKPEGPGERLANIAKKFVGVINPDFRTSDVVGGRLACAKVATTILKEAGLTDSILLLVDAAASKLKKQGWKEVKRPPRPGDVIVWAPTGGYIKDPGGVDVAKGHRHIGIALNATKVVSNSSSKKMPVEHNIFTKRPVEKILRAPTAMAA